MKPYCTVCFVVLYLHAAEYAALFHPTVLGDKIRVHLKNPATNQLPHSVDFHASQAAWNDEMTSINPGEEKMYEWTADYAGVWMYHCGSNPALHHIASGMYGMVIVEPKGGATQSGS